MRNSQGARLPNTHSNQSLFAPFHSSSVCNNFKQTNNSKPDRTKGRRNWKQKESMEINKVVRAHVKEACSQHSENSEAKHWHSSMNDIVIGYLELQWIHGEEYGQLPENTNWHHVSTQTITFCKIMIETRKNYSDNPYLQYYSQTFVELFSLQTDNC